MIYKNILYIGAVLSLHLLGACDTGYMGEAVNSRTLVLKEMACFLSQQRTKPSLLLQRLSDGHDFDQQLRDLGKETGDIEEDLMNILSACAVHYSYPYKARFVEKHLLKIIGRNLFEEFRCTVVKTDHLDQCLILNYSWSDDKRTQFVSDAIHGLQGITYWRLFVPISNLLEGSVSMRYLLDCIPAPPNTKRQEIWCQFAELLFNISLEWGDDSEQEILRKHFLASIADSKKNFESSEALISFENLLTQWDEGCVGYTEDHSSAASGCRPIVASVLALYAQCFEPQSFEAYLDGFDSVGIANIVRVLLVSLSDLGMCDVDSRLLSAASKVKDFSLQEQKELLTLSAQPSMHSKKLVDKYMLVRRDVFQEIIAEGVYKGRGIFLEYFRRVDMWKEHADFFEELGVLNIRSSWPQKLVQEIIRDKNTLEHYVIGTPKFDVPGLRSVHSESTDVFDNLKKILVLSQEGALIHEGLLTWQGHCAHKYLRDLVKRADYFFHNICTFYRFALTLAQLESATLLELLQGVQIEEKKTILKYFLVNYRQERVRKAADALKAEGDSRFSGVSYRVGLSSANQAYAEHWSNVGLSKSEAFSMLETHYSYVLTAQQEAFLNQQLEKAGYNFVQIPTPL